LGQDLADRSRGVDTGVQQRVHVPRERPHRHQPGKRGGEFHRHHGPDGHHPLLAGHGLHAARPAGSRRDPAHSGRQYRPRRNRADQLRDRPDETFLRGLSVYTIYQHQDQDRTPAEFAAEKPDNDFTDLRYGLEYNAWKLYLKAERQIRESELSPFDSLWLEARYVEPLGRGSNLGLSATYQQIDRTDDNVRTASTTLTGTWNQRITDHLIGSLIVVYQNIDGNVGFDTQAFEQTLNLRWIYRQTEVYAQFRNAIRDNTGADDTFFQTISVGLRREF
jgi:hypothetical protein